MHVLGLEFDRFTIDYLEFTTSQNKRKAGENILNNLDEKTDTHLKNDRKDVRSYHEIGAFSMSWPFAVFADHTEEIGSLNLINCFNN